MAARPSKVNSTPKSYRKVINYRWWFASNYGNFEVFRFVKNRFISIVETMQSLQMLPFIRCTIMGNKTQQLIDIDVQGDSPHNGTMRRMETATEICVRNRFHVPWPGDN
jgi:hypothetical protein